MNDLAATLSTPVIPLSTNAPEFGSACNPYAAALLQPITADFPAGQDLSYSTLFDEIREARRADDAGLAQGQWQTTVKTASWSVVRSLCEDALKSRTKDLQVAAWHTEALVHTQGFAGLAIGLEITHGLLSHYWNICYPGIEGDDLDERAGKIAWLNTQLAQALKQVPVTHRDHGAYSLLQWQESRWVENLGLRDGKAKVDAIADGKLSGEVFDKAAKESGARFYETLVGETQAASQALAALIAAADLYFGAEAPSLMDLRQALGECTQLVGRLHAELSEGATPSPEISASNDTSTAPTPVATGIKSVGTLQNRSDAIRALRDVASYFRVNEPQSPVALLAERAARWAEMSMDEWLAAVVKDEGTLGQLRELLDIRTGA
jgi:type VI secretion system protein ImpA